MTRERAAVMLLALLAACGPPSGAPPPDRCDSGSADGVAALVIGPSKDVAGAAFAAWNEGDGVEIIRGDQGGTMLVVRIDVGNWGQPLARPGRLV